MAGTTANYGLWKPDAPDQVRSAQGPLAANFDLIDETMFALYLLRGIDYTPGRVYIVGQPCFNAGSILRCITAHTGGGSIDLSKFQVISSGGGGGGIETVDGDSGPNIDLSGVYLGLLDGQPTPFHAASIGAVTYVPNLANWRHVITTTANPTINMPTVAVDGKARSWRLRLIMGGAGSQGDPTWDAKVTWRGLKSTRGQTAGLYDDYYFETENNTTWWGYHLSALFSHGQAYDDWTKLAGAPAAPPANTLREYVDTDDVLKVKDEHNEVHHCMIHVGTTAPTNTALLWMDIS